MLCTVGPCMLNVCDKVNKLDLYPCFIKSIGVTVSYKAVKVVGSNPVQNPSSDLLSISLLISETLHIDRWRTGMP